MDKCCHPGRRANLRARRPGTQQEGVYRRICCSRFFYSAGPRLGVPRQSGELGRGDSFLVRALSNEPNFHRRFRFDAAKPISGGAATVKRSQGSVPAGLAMSAAGGQLVTCRPQESVRSHLVPLSLDSARPDATEKYHCETKPKSDCFARSGLATTM